MDNRMGLGEWIGGAISAVGSVCSKIGGAIMGAVGSFVEGVTLSPVAGIAIAGEVLKTVVRVISAVADVLAEKPQDESPEEIGYKAKIAAEDEGKVPEDFDSVNAYIDYLRNDIKIDEERLAEMDEKERYTYASIGAGLYVKQVEEKYGMDLPPEFWRSTVSLEQEGKISKEMPADLINFMKEHDVKNGAVFSDFLSGKLEVGSKEQQNMYDALKDTYRKEYPEASESELNYKINTL